MENQFRQTTKRKANVALLLSGGSGMRLGGAVPKQYRKVGERMVIGYALETLLFHPAIDAVQIVAEAAWQDAITEQIKALERENPDKTSRPVAFSEPGKTRQLSILNGLEDIASYAADDSFVLIHDAARPMLTQEMVRTYFEQVKGHDGLLPVLPMKDTVYMSKDGSRITSLVARDKLYAGQAPELFVFGKYLEANRRLLPDEILKINGSTEPAVMAGMDIVLVEGDESNFKITTAADFERFCRLMEK